MTRSLHIKHYPSIILPFYLHGLWGSTFSFANAMLKAQRRHRRERDLVVAFGAPLPISATAAQVKQSVFELSVSTWQTSTRTLPTLPEAWLRTAPPGDAVGPVSWTRPAPH